MDWILEKRNKSERVSRNMIRRHAKEVFVTLDDTGRTFFSASRGWLEKFMVRNQLSLRRKTTMAQKDPDDMCKKLATFIAYVSQLRIKYKVEAQDIIAMDETSVWFDMVANTSVDHRGANSISLKSTGNEKSHLTVVLAAKGDCTKLKPYIVFKKAVREVKALQATKRVVIASSVNGWMNDSLTTDWLDKVYTKLSFKKRLLVWDSYRCHISQNNKSHFRKLNSVMAVVPGGLTKYIQAPDVSWNKPFKQHLTQRYDNWMAGDEDKEYTKGEKSYPYTAYPQ